MKDIPLFSDVLKGENLAAFNAWNGQNQITRVYTLPPGTPKERVAMLRKAYKAVMEDPDFLAEAKKAEAQHRLRLPPGHRGCVALHQQHAAEHQGISSDPDGLQETEGLSHLAQRLLKLDSTVGM